MWSSPFFSGLGLLLILLVRCYAVDQKDQVDILRAKAYAVGEDSPDYLGTWQQILALDPTSLEAHVMLGWKLITSSNGGLQEYGIELLEDSFDANKVAPTIVRYFGHRCRGRQNVRLVPFILTRTV